MARVALFVVVVLSALLLFTRSVERESVPERYRPNNDRAAYARALGVMELADTALGRDWLAAADRARRDAVEVRLPHLETSRFDPADPAATAYRFDVERGRQVEIVLDLETTEKLEGPESVERGTRVFLDVFRLPADGSRGGLVHVASAPPEEPRVLFGPRSDHTYLVVAQPELLRGGDYTMGIHEGPSLRFPVAEHGMSAIWSRFGVPREGGRRQHHGVDIFAPRGTLALASTRALVQAVEIRGLGGKVVWLWDPVRRVHLYYAHLDEWLVEPETWVQPGDPVGRVGNTGNARTTPPHLHFGVYAAGEGPVDPEPFLRPGARLPAVASNASDAAGATTAP